MPRNNLSWYTFDEMMRQNAEARRCLHVRLEQAQAKAGKLAHIVYGIAIGVVLTMAMKGC